MRASDDRGHTALLTHLCPPSLDPSIHLVDSKGLVTASRFDSLQHHKVRCS